MSKTITNQYTLTRGMWADIQQLLLKKKTLPGVIVGYMILWVLTSLLLYAIFSKSSFFKDHSIPEKLACSAAVGLVGTFVVLLRRGKEGPGQNFKEIVYLFQFSEEGVEKTTAISVTKTDWAGF